MKNIYFFIIETFPALVVFIGANRILFSILAYQSQQISDYSGVGWFFFKSEEALMALIILNDTKYASMLFREKTNDFLDLYNLKIAAINSSNQIQKNKQLKIQLS